MHAYFMHFSTFSKKHFKFLFKMALKVTEFLILEFKFFSSVIIILFNNLYRSIKRDTIPEEAIGGGRRPSWLPSLRSTPRMPVRRAQTLGAALMSQNLSPSSEESSAAEDEDIECLMKTSGF